MIASPRILIVEDEVVVQLHLRRILEELGYPVVGVAADATRATELAAESTPDLVLMDIRLRGQRDGIDAAQQLRDICDPGIVFVSAYADADTVARTGDVGALGYIVKPYSRNEIRAALATASLLHARLREAPRSLPLSHADPATPSAFDGNPYGLIGDSPAMQRVRERIAQLAALDWPVLLEGETGTGKEVCARAIHQASPRADGPFVAVNCAGLTESLLTSQLFGHEKGAFTGAEEARAGFFEAASGGVLFLDEIVDVSPGVQKALLRVLEDGMVQRVGAVSPLPVDVRVVSATQRDLAGEVAAGRFRADLLFRLRMLRVTLPPLRERGEDIIQLAEAFVGQASSSMQRPAPALSVSFRERLLAYPWPGNVRELRNAIHHAVVDCRGDVLEPPDLPPEMSLTGASGDGTPAGAPERDERQVILEAIARAGGNRKRAAALLGISRATLYRRIASLGIDPP
jgi:two-component system response regulator HydG